MKQRARLRGDTAAWLSGWSSGEEVWMWSPAALSAKVQLKTEATRPEGTASPSLPRVLAFTL